MRVACLRLFLFQTVFPSGPELPLAPRPPAPDFATSPFTGLATKRGLVPAAVGTCGADAPGKGVGFSLGLGDALGGVAFVVKKVLFTLMALNEAGFLTPDAVRLCPLSPWRSLALSDLAASVSDPPLMLTSAELTSSSTSSVTCLLSMLSLATLAVLAISLFTCAC